MRRRTRWPRLLAIAAIVVVAVIAVAWLLAPAPSVPPNAGVLLATTSVQGPVLPDASEGAELPTTPKGQECVASLQRSAGRLDLCWAVTRVGNDADAESDYYTIRVYGTAVADGTGLRWTSATVRAAAASAPMSLLGSWPSDGTVGDPCAQVVPDLFGYPGDLPPETICPNTTGSSRGDAVANGPEQSVVWTCVRCLLPTHDDRSVILYQFVSVPEGRVPAWDVYGDLGD
jgi:hypothetical protein